MKIVKKLLDLIPLLILWLMLSVFLWGWIFTFLTDAPAENKITLFIDAPVPEDTALAVRLEEGMAEPIRMVKVHPFSYAMINGDTLRNADLFIISASEAETYREWFAPLPEEMLDAGPLLEIDGVPVGVKVCGAAQGYIAYSAGDYYLFFGNDSLHVASNEGAVDGEAVKYARLLLDME